MVQWIFQGLREMIPPGNVSRTPSWSQVKRCLLGGLGDTAAVPFRGCPTPLMGNGMLLEFTAHSVHTYSFYNLIKRWMATTDDVFLQVFISEPSILNLTIYGMADTLSQGIRLGCFSKLTPRANTAQGTRTLRGGNVPSGLLFQLGERQSLQWPWQVKTPSHSQCIP